MMPFADCTDCVYARASQDGLSSPLCTYNAPVLVFGQIGVISPGFPPAVMRCREYTALVPPSQRPRPRPPKNE